LPYLVMRFLDAGTLKNRMRASPQAADGRPGLSMVEIDRIFTQMADALSYAHDQGVIHRDIKSSNIMLDHRGDVFLIEVGIAKLIESTVEFTAKGSVTGTPAYMSPEQAQV
jgi:serine/threonine-protein kinase